MTDQAGDVARSSHSSLPVLVASVLVVLAVVWLVLGRLSGDPPPAAAAASAAGAPPPAPTSTEAFEPVRRTVALEALPAESGKIRLVVVDPVGRPVEGAEVRRGRLAGRELIDCVTATTTDPAGCAVLPAEADRLALAIGASGYASEVVPTVSPGTLRVVLTPGSRLRVVCENLAGAPVQGLRLCAYQRAVGAHVVADDDARPPISASVVDRSDVVWTAVTDRLGVAEFGDVSSGTLIWEVADEGHAIVRIDGDGSKVIELQPGQAMDVRAVVEPLLAAVVHVRGGDVLTHAWIAPRKIPLSRRGNDIWIAQHRLSSRYGGALCIAGVPSRLPERSDPPFAQTLQLQTAEHGPIEREVTLATWEDVTPIEVDLNEYRRLTECPRPVVRLRDARGHELPGVRLDLVTVSGDRRFPIVTGRRTAVPSGSYVAKCLSHAALGKALRQVEAFDVEGTTDEVIVELRVSANLHRIRLHGIGGLPPRNCALDVLEGGRIVDQSTFLNPELIEVVTGDVPCAAEIKAFGYRPHRVELPSAGGDVIDAVLEPVR